MQVPCPQPHFSRPLRRDLQWCDEVGRRSDTLSPISRPLWRNLRRCDEVGAGSDCPPFPFPSEVLEAEGPGGGTRKERWPQQRTTQPLVKLPLPDQRVGTTDKPAETSSLPQQSKREITKRPIQAINPELATKSPNDRRSPFLSSLPEWEGVRG